MTDAHGVDPIRKIGWIPTMKLGGSRSGNRVVPYGEIGWIPKRKFCRKRPYIGLSNHGNYHKLASIRNHDLVLGLGIWALAF